MFWLKKPFEKSASQIWKQAFLFPWIAFHCPLLSIESRPSSEKPKAQSCRSRLESLAQQLGISSEVAGYLRELKGDIRPELGLIDDKTAFEIFKKTRVYFTQHASTLSYLVSQLSQQALPSYVFEYQVFETLPRSEIFAQAMASELKISLDPEHPVDDLAASLSKKGPGLLILRLPSHLEGPRQQTRDWQPFFSLIRKLKALTDLHLILIAPQGSVFAYEVQRHWNTTRSFTPRD